MSYHNPTISNKSFLVTGGAGFIGSNIAEYLIRNGAAKVRVLDNLSNGFMVNIEPYLNLPSFEFIEGDITNPEVCAVACKGIDMVTHQAALGSVPRSIAHPQQTHAANATGFLNMIVAARDAGVERFVYASSSSVYGDLDESPKKEERTGNLLSPYAVSKYTNELYASVFARNYGMKVIGLRYFNVFGPRQDPKGPYAAVIPLFMDALINNKEAWINGDGEQTRDFTFVANAVQANIRSFFTEDPNAFGKVYNVATGENHSVNKLFQVLAEIAGKSAGPKYRDDRPGDIKNSLADISLAGKHLGYHPEVRLRQGLETTFDWFRQTF
jgi:UDP-N-acetylglucosamine 4-epimerase